MYKLAFFGTPQFALKGLEALHESLDFQISKVITSPDRPAGRKLKPKPSPVKTWALGHGLEVWTPSHCKSQEFIQDFKNLNVDGAIVIAFGQILSQDLLDICPQKFINVHASLLPRWRGAAPIQRAIINGDTKTGVCLQSMVLKLDAGDIISQEETEISERDTAIDLHDRLSEMGAHRLQKTLKSYFEGKIAPVSQEDSKATYASKIQSQESRIDWFQSAFQIWNLIRGLALGPGGVSFLNSKRLKLIKCQPLSEEVNSEASQELLPGAIKAIYKDSFDIACGERTCLRVFSLQPESKLQMSAKDFLNGYAISVGLKLEPQ